MLKKILKTIGIVLVVLAVLVVGWFEYSTPKNNAAPGELALAALISDDIVTVEDGDWLVMRPTNGSPTTGLIIYPGANCDIRGYAPLMREIAAAGYLVVAQSMPYDMAFLALNSAKKVPTTYPEITDWFLTGHSLGGAMTGTFAADNADLLTGVIFWDAYPAVSLADSPLPVTAIHRATLEGEAPENFKPFFNDYMPPNTTFVPVRGGIHMYFGSFIGGGYEELWEPQISVGEQHRIIIDATVAALESTD
jgi:hypothetical protein